jgi:site-specific DNA recombinase
MSKKKYFSYIRVSTVRQGQSGTSLLEQRSAIERYSARYGLAISKEFEEQETAAKQGRPVFLDMIRELKRNKAAGVVMHKIDRSARNLKDWAELGELIDRGIEVHFANENLDLYSRGGRLSADIQAVVAADYIRNLREEVKKGFYGRLKQGYYPMPAPLGYLDKGAGVPKEIDPRCAGLVKKAFELYATGHYSIRVLQEKMTRLGLTNKSGKSVSKNSLAEMLHNPFYLGNIRLKKTNEIYAGNHLPIISTDLFRKVQGVFEAKLVPQIYTNRGLEEVFLYRKLIVCEPCRKRLAAERHKNHLYYRCYNKSCNKSSVREEVIDDAFREVLRRLTFTDAEMAEAERWFDHRHKTSAEDVENAKITISLQLKQTQERLSKLTDAFLDGLIDKEIFVQKKNSLVQAEGELKERLAGVDNYKLEALGKTKQFVKMAFSAYSSYPEGKFEHRVEMVKTVTQNFLANGKSVKIKLNLPFELLANRPLVPDGAPDRETVGTISALLSQVLKYFLESNDLLGLK